MLTSHCEKAPHLFVGRPSACLLTLFFALLLAACGRSKSSDTTVPAADTTVAEQAVLPEAMQGRDSTIYGRADGFGQSALTLVANDGRELDLALTAEHHAAGASPYASVYGDREDTARYAVTTCDGGEAVRVLINLSQLERFLKTYAIHNGRLFVPDEGGTFHEERILQLDDELLMTEDAQGNIHRWRR